MRIVAQTAIDNETYFGELDAVVGDGDLGYSLARGFSKLLEGFDEMEYEDLGGLLKKTALVLSGRIGGTSGPIWGTAFLRAGVALTPTPEPTPTRGRRGAAGRARGDQAARRRRRRREDPDRRPAAGDRPAGGRC